MIFFISNIVTASGITDTNLMAHIKKKLTIANPFYNKKVDLGLSTFGVPTVLKYYTQATAETIQFPTGALPDILRMSVDLGHVIKPEDLIDARLDRSDLGTEFFKDVVFTGTLRDYQEDVVTATAQKTVGVVEALTGSGKSICFIKMVVDRKVPTLILVHTKELLNQVIDSFVKFTNIKKESIGVVGEGRFELKTITIGMHQTMHRLDDQKFG